MLLKPPSTFTCDLSAIENNIDLSSFGAHLIVFAYLQEMAAHSSVLAWRIPGTGEPGRRLSMGSHRVGHDWSNLAAAAAAQGWKPHQTKISSEMCTELQVKWSQGGIFGTTAFKSPSRVIWGANEERSEDQSPDSLSFFSTLNFSLLIFTSLPCLPPHPPSSGTILKVKGREQGM